MVGKSAIEMEKPMVRQLVMLWGQLSENALGTWLEQPLVPHLEPLTEILSDPP